MKPKYTKVPPRGPLDAAILFCGEQPGQHEIRKGRPFVGPAGAELMDDLIVAGINHIGCYYTNVIKDLDHPLSWYITYNPRKGYVPTANGEWYEYVELLRKEIDAHKANIIVAVGGIALFALTNRRGITNWRGSVIESTICPGRKVLPILHPSTVIPPKNQYLNKHLIIQDLLRAKEQSEFPEINRTVRKSIVKPDFYEACRYLTDCYLEGIGSTLDVDIEVSPSTEEMICFSIAKSPTEAMCIALCDSSGDIFDPDQEATIISLLGRIMESPDIAKRGQNFAFDVEFLLSRYGIKARNCIYDTMVAQKILMPDFFVRLEFITTMWTDIPYYKADGKKWFKGTGSTWEQLWHYNNYDSISTADAGPKQIEALCKQGNYEIYQEQARLIEPLVYMARKGMRVDQEGMLRDKDRTEAAIKEKEQELWDLVGYQINPRSPQQLANYFYIEKGHPPYKTKGRVTTDKTALVRLARKGFKEAELIGELRSLEKRAGTYLAEHKISQDGRMRCYYNPAGAETGRLSSSENIFGEGMDMQNWPHDLLQYLLADEGYIYYSFDLSQIENRIVAYYGPVPQMIDAFETDKDVHRLTAALIFGKPYDAISNEDGSCAIGGGKYSERFWGKKSNHAFNYGLGYRKFSLQTEIPEREAKWIREQYHRAYPGVQDGFQARVRAQLAKDRTVTNLYGRKRLFLDRWGQSTFNEAYAQIPQSTTADKINREGLNYIYYNQTQFAAVELLNQIHDSVGFQIPLSIPWSVHAAILWQIRSKLETPLVAHNREFVVPVDLTIGFSMAGGIELKHGSFPPSINALEMALKESYDKLREETK